MTRVMGLVSGELSHDPLPTTPQCGDFADWEGRAEDALRREQYEARVRRAT
jgi:hypothetical protein